MTQHDHSPAVPTPDSTAYALTDDDLRSVAGGTDQRTPGLSCPGCGAFIPVTIHQLLCTPRLTCPTCGLHLDIDQQKLQF